MNTQSEGSINRILLCICVTFDSFLTDCQTLTVISFDRCRQDCKICQFLSFQSHLTSNILIAFVGVSSSTGVCLKHEAPECKLNTMSIVRKPSAEQLTHSCSGGAALRRTVQRRGCAGQLPGVNMCN